MQERDPHKDPASFAFESPAWEGVQDLAPSPPLSEAQMSVLRRVANGEGLFQILDAQLRPAYDFGATESVESQTVEALLAARVIEFQGAPGFALPSRARLTALGQELSGR